MLSPDSMTYLRPALQEARELVRFARPHGDLPARHLFLERAGKDGDIPGDDELLVLDVLLHAALGDERRDLAGRELPCRPGREHRKALVVHDREPGRHLAVLDL